jgi:hypothetical protein
MEYSDEFQAPSLAPPYPLPTELPVQVSRDQAGRLVYRWHDTEIQGLCSMKLWDILRQTYPGRDPLSRALAIAIRGELACRGDSLPPG